MESIRVLIVDDEHPARRKIRAFLKKEQGIGDILEAANGIETVRMIREQKPDLVFLDIQMPGMNGFEVIEAVGIEHIPVVVFVTAYDKYAIDAFEVQAADYLLKPFDEARFNKSFRRALKRIELSKKDASDIRGVLEEIRKKAGYLERIMVNVGSKYFFIVYRYYNFRISI